MFVWKIFLAYLLVRNNGQLRSHLNVDFQKFQHVAYYYYFKLVTSSKYMYACIKMQHHRNRLNWNLETNFLFRISTALRYSMS